MRHWISRIHVRRIVAEKQDRRAPVSIASLNGARTLVSKAAPVAAASINFVSDRPRLKGVSGSGASERVETFARHAVPIVRPWQRRVVLDPGEARDARGQIFAEEGRQRDVLAVCQNLLENGRQKVEPVGVAARTKKR